MLKTDSLTSLFLKTEAALLCLLVLNSCGYGFTSLKNPWEKYDVKTVNVPMFENKTMEGGAEVYFTNSLRLYLTSRSGKLKFVRSGGDAYIDGVVKNIKLRPAGVIFGTAATEAAGGLPAERLLAQSYVIRANVNLKMVRAKDKKVIWSKSFTQSRTMHSGVYTDERKSSNVFIKESSKKEAIRELSDTMMMFAVDSLLEEF